MPRAICRAHRLLTDESLGRDGAFARETHETLSMLDLSQPSLPLLGLEQAVDRPEQVTSRRPRKPVPSAAPDPTPALDGCGAAELRALRLAFLGVASRWALSGAEALTLLGEPLAAEPERHERLNALVGLNRSLLLLLPEPDRALGYLRRPCPDFDEASPLQLMLAGGASAIARVRAHLAATAFR